MKGHLRVTLLLEVRDDALTDQLGVADHVQHLIILPVDQGKLEPVLSGVNGHGAGLAISVEKEDLATSHLGQVDGEVKGSNDAVIAVSDGVLDVVGGGVDEDAGVVPGSGFDSGVLVDETEQLEFLVADIDGVLGKQSHGGHVRGPHDIP